MVRERPLPFPPEPLASAGINLTRWSLDRADHREGRRNGFLRVLDRAGLGFDSSRGSTAPAARCTAETRVAGMGVDGRSCW